MFFVEASINLYNERSPNPSDGSATCALPSNQHLIPSSFLVGA